MSEQTMVEEAQSYGAVGHNALMALRCCEKPTPEGLKDVAARGFGHAVGACVSIKALPQSTWALEHGAQAPAPAVALRLGARAMSAASEGMGEREKAEALGELWAQSARFALMEGAVALKYKATRPKAVLSWLLDSLLDEEGLRRDMAPAVALAHLSALTRGAVEEGRASVRGWQAPLIARDRAWAFHMGAIEWALGQSDQVDLAPGLLAQALRERLEDVEETLGGEERDEALARMRRIETMMERGQISAASASGEGSKRAPRL